MKAFPRKAKIRLPVHDGFGYIFGHSATSVPGALVSTSSDAPRQIGLMRRE